MTAPRQVLAGRTYLVTRRCSERRFFLRPSAETNETVSYLLAVGAERYGIELHVVCVLSNHLHIVLTDPCARLPEFHRFLDGLIARSVNSLLGRWESLWDRESYSAVHLATPRDVLEKMVYVLANPVAAGLVRRGQDWPGVWSDPAWIGGPAMIVARPKDFFREKGPLPPAATLRFVRPPGFEKDAEVVAALRHELRLAEDRAASQAGREGRGFIGALRVLAQRPTARPVGADPRRGLKPALACRNKWRRLENLVDIKEFRNAHEEALAAWRAGVRDVLFPPGTWAMRVHHGARCVTAA